MTESQKFEGQTDKIQQSPKITQDLEQDETILENQSHEENIAQIKPNFEANKLILTNTAWRARIFARKFAMYYNIVIIGQKGCGKTSTVQSICRSLFPDKQMVISHQENGHISVQLIPNISLWEVPPLTNSDTSIKTIGCILTGEVHPFPSMNLMILILNPEDAQQLDFLTNIKSLYCFAISKGISVLFYVTKLDCIPAHDLSDLFNTFSQLLQVRRELLFPIKNMTHETSSELLDYFILRVLDKTLAYLV